MSTLLEAGLGGAERLLGSRLVLAVLLPVLLAAGGSTLLGLAAAGLTPDDALAHWQGYQPSGQLMAAAWLLLGLVAAAYVLALFHLPFVRVLEGYWPQTGPLARLRRVRTDRHRARATAGWDRVRALRDAGEATGSSALAARLLTSYPPPPRLAHGCLPTALGNRLRATEYYPLERYGIDAVVVFPRLRPFLPADAVARVTSGRTAFDGTVSVLALSAGFGTAWPVALLACGRPWLAVLALAAWPVAWVAHRAALQAAVAYGQEVRVVFDLHRGALLRHLGLDVPSAAGADAERRVWDDLSQFYLRNLPLTGDVPAQAASTQAAPAPPSAPVPPVPPYAPSAHPLP